MTESKKIHILWVNEKADFIEESEIYVFNASNFFKRENVKSTLLYSVEGWTNPKYLNNFDLAFPIVNIECQIEEINPDIIYIHRLENKKNYDDFLKCDKPIVKFSKKNKFNIIKVGKNNSNNVLEFCKNLDSKIKNNLKNILTPDLEVKEKAGKLQIPDKPEISIIMRSKNSDWVIAQALAALFSQEIQEDFELLVIDSGSSDRTLEIVKEYPCRLIKIEAKSYYPGTVLNMAIKEARGELIVFQNSDAVPLCQHTLKRLISTFNDNNIHAALGRQIVRPEADGWVRRDYEESFPDADITPSWIKLSLPLAAMRKSVWEKHNFYTDAWASEDTEWGNWAKQNGYNIKYVKDAILMHSHNYSLKQIYGRKFVEGEADVFIYEGKENIFKMLKRIISSIIKDTIKQFSFFDLKDVFIMPIRRFVYHYAYYKGHKFGEKRIKSGDNDIAKGQEVVLSRYEK